MMRMQRNSHISDGNVKLCNSLPVAFSPFWCKSFKSTPHLLANPFHPFLYFVKLLIFLLGSLSLLQHPPLPRHGQKSLLTLNWSVLWLIQCPWGILFPIPVETAHINLLVSVCLDIDRNPVPRPQKELRKELWCSQDNFLVLSCLRMEVCFMNL